MFEKIAQRNFFKCANPSLFLFIFVFSICYNLNSKFKLGKACMVCLGFEPGAAGWKAQMNIVV